MRAVVGLAVSLLLVVPAAPALAEERELCSFSSDTLAEISGIATSTRYDNIVWAHNDSGGGPYVYAVDITDCKIKATITLSGVDARDFEAIAMGKGQIWLGDIGDNLDSWPNVELLSFKEPKELTDQAVTPTTYRFTYEDRPHNAEAIMVDPDSNQVWVITKQLAHGSLYRLPNPLRTDGMNIATKLKRQGGLVTDASIAPDASKYVVRDYVDAKVYADLPPGKKVSEFALPLQLQGEAVTWTADSSALIVASERDRAMLRVDIPEPIPTPTSTSTASPNPNPKPSPSPKPSPNDQPFPAGLVIGAVAAALGLCGLGLGIALARRRRVR